IFDINLRIIEANSSCELRAGCTEKEMVGRNYYEVFKCHNKLGHYHPDFDPVSKVLTTKESIPYDEHLHTDKDGRERWVGVSYTPVVDERGEIEQIVSVVRDITKIKELEKAKTEFVSLASHELRTPLTVINGYLSLLLNGDLGSLENEKNRTTFLTVLDKVKNETNRLTKLVEELLNVSRIEGGRLRLSFRKVSVVETLDSVINEFKPIAAMKGIRVNVSHDLPYKNKNVYVLADKDKFKQILVNLLDNAIKFTESGGVVKTESFLKGDKIQINIEDSGVGIDPNILPRIFEKFQQVHGSYLKENMGTGLGLFIVKSLVDLHNGEVTVDSKVGKGTTFSFTLPVVATH
ncbi:PAS domain-containing sensor histidine kinase, partial [Patescibacteria group bacterium]|nr:PAS domain-containing sensor histidine kinase [Patescibacteria group bacterium]